MCQRILWEAIQSWASKPKAPPLVSDLPVLVVFKGN
jgi:hypothetical protein